MEESLEHIRESAETRMRKNAFMLHNYIELERVEKDRAVFKLDIRPESCNPYADSWRRIYTLADNATGAAAHSDGRYYVTQTSALHFLRNQATGRCGPLLGSGTVEVHGAHRCRHHWRGRQAAGTGEFTFFCVDKALMDQKAGAEQK